MSHDLHQKISLLFGGRSFWKNLNTLGDLKIECLNVLHLLNGVVHQETDVGVDPQSDGVLELLNEWSSVDSQPSNIDSGLH